MMPKRRRRQESPTAKVRAATVPLPPSAWRSGSAEALMRHCCGRRGQRPHAGRCDPDGLPAASARCERRPEGCGPRGPLSIDCPLWRRFAEGPRPFYPLPPGRSVAPGGQEAGGEGAGKENAREGA